MASTNVNTILVIGATSGIGKSIALRYHSLGKKVIATGRRTERLGAMKKAFPGLETQQTSAYRKPSPKLLLVHAATTIVIVTSALGLVPAPMYPIYNATKAALMMFSHALRVQLADSQINVIEVPPPYVATELGKELENTPVKPMDVETYVDTVIAGLSEEVNGGLKLVVGHAFSQMVADTWEKDFGGYFKRFAAMFERD